jgi:chromosome partitioning protein
VAKLLETVQLVSRRMNPRLKVSGIVLTLFDAQTKLGNEVVSELKSFIGSASGKSLPWSNATIFRSKIRRNIKLAESPGFGQTIIAYDPTSNGAADYRALAREVLEMEQATLALAPPASAPIAVSINPALAGTGGQTFLSAAGRGAEAYSPPEPAPSLGQTAK